jgi:anti-anti-sigma factor
VATENPTDSSSFFELTTDGGKSIFVIKKSLTETNWSDIDLVGQEILKSIEQISGPQMVADLSELDYMGSSMVALLLRIWKQVNAQEGKMVFVNREEEIHEILKLAGLTKIWTICESREEAAQHLVSPLQQTGKNLSPLLVIGALIATIIGLGSYLLLHFDTAAVDAVLLGKLQIAGSIVGMILTLWLLKSTSGKSRAASFSLFLLASVTLSLGFLDLRIPGSGNSGTEKQSPASSAPKVELGESDSSDKPPPGLFGENDEPKKSNQESEDSVPDSADPLTAPNPEQGTP